jgi:hypothetical protein
MTNMKKKRRTEIPIRVVRRNPVDAPRVDASDAARSSITDTVVLRWPDKTLQFPLTKPAAGDTVAKLAKPSPESAVDFRTVRAGVAHFEVLAKSLPANPTTALEVINDLRMVRDSLRDALLPLMNATLRTLAGHRLESLDENRRLVSEINALRDAYGLVLCIKPDGRRKSVPVYVSCNDVPRAKSGSFQAREIAGARRTLHAKTTFPALEFGLPAAAADE